MGSIPISLVIRHFFFLPKQSQKSRSGLQDRSRSLGLFRKGKTCTAANFHRTDSVIFSHSREGKTLSYSQINTILLNDTILFYWSKFLTLSEMRREVNIMA